MGEGVGGCNLTKVTQGAQSRRFTYDSQNRLISAANVESGRTRSRSVLVMRWNGARASRSIIPPPISNWI